MPEAYQIYFFETANGNRPVEDYLERLRISKNPKDRTLFTDILAFINALAQRGNSLGMPYVRKLKGTDLWELRPKSERIIYCVMHGSQKTRLKEIRTAMQRYKQLLSEDLKVMFAGKDERIMENREAKVNHKYVGRSFDEYLNETLTQDELKLIKAKTDFLLQLIDLRKEANLTQSELGKMVGLKQSTIAKIEKGVISTSFDNLFKMLAVMGKTIKITPL